MHQPRAPFPPPVPLPSALNQKRQPLESREAAATGICSSLVGWPQACPVGSVARQPLKAEAPLLLWLRLLLLLSALPPCPRWESIDREPSCVVSAV
jgi:hypothetical protein